jgi:hypothetical protein
MSSNATSYDFILSSKTGLNLALSFLSAEVTAAMPKCIMAANGAK